MKAFTLFLFGSCGPPKIEICVVTGSVLVTLIFISLVGIVYLTSVILNVATALIVKLPPPANIGAVNVITISLLAPTL